VSLRGDSNFQTQNLTVPIECTTAGSRA
jgi:hypothetical protein